MDQLMNILNYLPKLNSIRAPSELNLDWYKYFDNTYKRPDGGTVTKNHILRSDSGNTAELTT